MAAGAAQSPVQRAVVLNWCEDAVKATMLAPYLQLGFPFDVCPGQRSAVSIEPAGKAAFIRTDLFGCLAKSVPEILPGAGVLENTATICLQGEEIEGEALDGGSQGRLALGQFLLNLSVLRSSALQFGNSPPQLLQFGDQLLFGLVPVPHDFTFPADRPSRIPLNGDCTLGRAG